MTAPFPSPVETWHNDTYPDIHPTNPELSQQGKTIIITGAGSGIGKATALAFAEAGAKHIALLGRTQETLQETSSSIKNSFSKTSTSIFAASVADDHTIHNIAREIGAWDVLVLNAAHITSPDTVLNIPLSEFWESFETNVKSVYIAAQAFIPRANPNAAIIALNTAGSILPATVGAGLTGYFSSKVAQGKLIEYLAHEHPDMFMCSVHPGVVPTKMLVKSELDKSKLPRDTVELPAHFMLWLASNSQEKKYLHGRMVWANWDVGELAGKAEDIERGFWCTMGTVGWPFGQADKLEMLRGSIK